jgi:hypothetical protein
VTEKGVKMTDKKAIMCHGIAIPVDACGTMDIPLYSLFISFCH